jgi:hypothetical protein
MPERVRAGISHSHNIFTVKIEKRLKPRAAAHRLVAIGTVWKKLASAEDTLPYHRFLVGFFGVSAVLEEGACLEAADGRCHPIKGSCTLGRTTANTNRARISQSVAPLRVHPFPK